MISENKLTLKNYRDFLELLRKQALENQNADDEDACNYMEGFQAGIEAAQNGLEIYFG